MVDVTLIVVLPVLGWLCIQQYRQNGRLAAIEARLEYCIPPKPPTPTN